MFMHLTFASPFMVSNLQRVQGLLDVLKNSGWMLMIWSVVFPGDEERKKTLPAYVIHLKRSG